MKCIYIKLLMIFPLISTFLSTDAQNTIQAIDLGLPSGTLWCDRNLGANSIGEPGYYYMWGEVVPRKKKDCNWKQYKYTKSKSWEIYTPTNKYNNIDKLTSLNESDDAAFVSLASPWHIPTRKEMQELLDFCLLKPTIIGTQKAVVFIGPNGNSITIPETLERFTGGYRDDSFLQLWTSSLGNSPEHAYALNKDDYDYAVCNIQRCYPNLIRPVYTGNRTYTYNQPEVCLTNIINDTQKLSFDIEIVSPYIKILNDYVWINKKNTEHDAYDLYPYWVRTERPKALTNTDNFSVIDHFDFNKQKNSDFFQSSEPICCQIGVKTGLGVKWYTYYISGNQLVGKNKKVSNIATLTFNSPITTTSSTYNLGVSANSSSAITASKVLVNGVTTRGVNTVKNDGAAFRINEQVTLREGDNSIYVEVTNAAGTAKIEKTVTYRKATPNPIPHPTPIVKKTEVIKKQKCLALVVGNSKYTAVNFPALKNTTNDSKDISAKLRSLGIDVIEKEDLTYTDFYQSIADFAQETSKYDVAMFYYSGHAVEIDGINYLVPVNAKGEKPSYLPGECVSVDKLLKSLSDARSNSNIIVLDACRSHPNVGTKGYSEGGLHSVIAPKGTMIMFATAPGKTAYDGNGRNSPYTSVFLKCLDKPNLKLNDFAQELIDKVSQQTNEEQVPWFNSGFRGTFYFNKK